MQAGIHSAILLKSGNGHHAYMASPCKHMGKR